jgi:predicted nucleic acid-binding protein
MSVFIDTNVLVRSIEPSSSMHDAAVRAIVSIIASGEVAVVTPQIMAEFRNVAIRPLEKTDWACPLNKPTMKYDKTFKLRYDLVVTSNQGE